jgi:hypothetical protein
LPRQETTNLGKRSVDQHPETQTLDLCQMAAQRGFQIVTDITDRTSGKFDVLLVWASDRIAS